MKAKEILENRIGFVRLSISFCECVSVEEWNIIFSDSRIVDVKEKEGIRKIVLYRKDFEPIEKGENIPEYFLTVYTDQISGCIDSVVWSKLKSEDHKLYKEIKNLCKEINEKFSNKDDGHLDKKFIEDVIDMAINELPKYALDYFHSRMSLISNLL